MRLFAILPIAAMIMLCDLSIAGQTTGGLVASISDPNGNIVAGAETEILPAAGPKRTAVSSDLGVVTYRDLAAGKYTLRVRFSGFKDHSSQVEIRSHETKRIDIVLDLTAIESVVDVNQNQESADNAGASGARDLQKTEIENLPDDPEQLLRALQAMAGPTLTGEQMPVSVNGVPGATVPNKANIKLVRINRNVFSAQYEYSYGGGIEIYTDADIKKVSGFIGANFSDSRLNAANPYIGRRVPARQMSFNYGFSAPLGRKASIGVFSSHSSVTTSSAVNATILSPSFAPTELRESYETPRLSGYHDAYINWDPNKKHKVTGQFSFSYGKADFADLNGLSLASRGNKTSYRNLSLAFVDTYIVNPEFVNTTRFAGRIETTTSKGMSSEAALNVSEAFLGGGSQNDQHRTSSTVEIYNDTTRKFGRLNAGFGIMMRGYRLEDITRSNFGGTYTFSGRIAPALDADLQPVRDPLGNIITEQITSLESYRRTLALRARGVSPAQIRALGGGADQFTIAGGRPDLSVNQLDYSVYQQNNFGFSDTLGISFGVRYENQTRISDATNFAPRFGFTWAPKAKPKQHPFRTLPRITLGYGVFYNRFGIANAMRELQANSTERSFYFVTDPAVLDTFPLVPSVSQLEQAAALRSLRLIDDELRAPVTNIFNANIAKNLIKGMTLSGGYTRSRGSRATLTRNINAPFADPEPNAAPRYPFGNPRNIYETRSEGRTVADRFFVSVNANGWKLLGKPLFLGAWYNFAKIRSDVVDGSSSPRDPYDFRNEWGATPADGVHSVFLFANFSLPKGISVRMDGNFRTGSRFNIFTGRDTNRDGIYAERPAYAADPTAPDVIRTPYGLLDIDPAPNDTLIPRNLGRGPGGGEINLYLSKSFGFNPDKANKNTPKQRLQFAVWINNVLNQNNKGNPIGNISSPNFLRSVTASSFDGEFRPSNPRRFQFSTSFSF